MQFINMKLPFPGVRVDTASALDHTVTDMTAMVSMNDCTYVCVVLCWGC